MKKTILAIIISVLFILTGCTSQKTDLDKLQGDWRNDSGGIIIYAPNEKDDIYGDAHIIDNDNTKTATYEWHESSQRLLLTYSDDWGDLVTVTYNYEICDNSTLELTPIEYSDSTATRSIDNGETQVFEKMEE